MTQATSARGRLLERLRWRLVWQLCRLPRTCSANLITWAAWGDRRQVTKGRWKQDNLCRDDAWRNGSCYCGKLKAGA